ncbi:MAG TPA: hypothetical protein VGI81_10655 [Tepidisphaeraceae bacterium]|jgi:hypothetical protein
MNSEQPTPAQPLEYTGPFSDDVYRDRTKGWRRRFTISGDRLIIEARQFFGSESETTVLLRDINPMYNIVRVRSPMAGGGVLVFAIVFLVFALLPYVNATTGPLPSLWQTLTHGPTAVCLGVALIYAIVGLVNIRRIEHYQFVARGVRFDIARKGPDRDRFDAFIARLLARVQEARRPAAGTTASKE